MRRKQCFSHTFFSLINSFKSANHTPWAVIADTPLMCTLVCVCVCLCQSRQLESETGTTEEHSLNKEARKWATRVAREHKNIIHCKRVRSTNTYSSVARGLFQNDQKWVPPRHTVANEIKCFCVCCFSLWRSVRATACPPQSKADQIWS